VTATTGMGGTASAVGQHTVVGMFSDVGRAERALNGLKEAGFTPEQVSAVAKDREDMQQMSDNTEMVANSAAGGAVTGSVLGGIAGFLVGISALVIPGIGPIVGSGILLSTLAGAGIGAAAGGLIGALAEHGVPEEDARGYQSHVEGGRILLTVHADDDEQAMRAHEILNTGRGTDVRAYGTGAAQSSMSQIGRSSGMTGTTSGMSSGTTGGTMSSGTEHITSTEMRDSGSGRSANS